LDQNPFVGIDDRAAARACAQLLKDLGHERFSIVTFQLGSDEHVGFVDKKRLESISFEVPCRRIEGYLDVLAPSQSQVSVKIWECVRSDQEGGRVAAESLFSEEPRPTAILATSDRLAIGILEVARAHRLRVPEELAVVGFDDIPAATIISPKCWSRIEG
jgi:DNA-binding LacI/PurR family transcriptional regulator